MRHEINNPFRRTPDAKPNLTALGEQFLLLPDIPKLSKLEEQKDRGSKFDIRGSIEGVSLEEGLNPEERKKFESLEIRKGIIAWAKEFDIGGTAWVDLFFKYRSDGTAIREGGLSLHKKEITYFPKGIVEVTGGDVFLDNINATEMPRYISIGGQIVVMSYQTDLIRDLKAKGCRVYVNSI